MKRGNQYIIPFRGLVEGQHNFDFQIGRTFFEENLALSIEKGSIDINIVLVKSSNFLNLDVELDGEVDLQCDRCLEPFSFALRYRGQLLVKFKEEPDEPDENVIYLHPNEDILDLNQYFFDCIGLSIPIQKIHPEDDTGEPTCNIQMLSLINAHSFKEDENEDTIDPRWSKLQDLLKDKNKNI